MNRRIVSLCLLASFTGIVACKSAPKPAAVTKPKLGINPNGEIGRAHV